MISKSISINKVFSENTTKELRFAEVRATFPSIGFGIRSYVDLNPFLDTEKEHAIQNISLLCLPIFSARKMIYQIGYKLSDERQEIFFKNHPIMVDWETEHWYKSTSLTERRLKAFEHIKDKPDGWKKLFTIPNKDDPNANRRNFHISKAKYDKKLKDFFGKGGKSIRLVTACMKYAYEELKSSFVIPPAPFIIDSGISSEKALEVNEIFNSYAKTFDLFTAAYYNLHPNVLEYRSVHKKILDQINRLEPKIVIIAGQDCNEYLFPKNHYNTKKPNFDKFMQDLAIYARTTESVVLWLDKGDYSSSYGFKLIKQGLDGFIYPLKGNSMESSSGVLQYGSILDEYVYYTWNKWLGKIKTESPCHLDCCKDLKKQEFKDMTPHQQWAHKRKHELILRNTQMNQLLEKLNKEGNLGDFVFRLKRNYIS